MSNSISNHLFIVFCVDHYTPLGAVRSLGEYGIQPIVILVTKGKKPVLVNNSKYVKVCYLVDTIEDGFRLMIEKYGNEKEKPFVISSDDKSESFLDLHHNELIDRFIFFHSSEQGMVTKIMQKENMLKVAEECGIKIPKSAIVTVGDLNHGLTYPVMTKAMNGLGKEWKDIVYICKDEEDLKEAYSKIKSEKIILQQYIKKKNELCLDGLVACGGKVVYFPLRCEYLRMTDTSYGTYMRFWEFDDQKVLDQLGQFFSKVPFTGIVSVEFLIDQNDDLYFLEVNFRNSTWNYAYTVAGFNLPVIWAESELAGHLVVDSKDKLKLPITAMVESADLLEHVVHGKTSLWQWLRDVKNCDCFYFYNKLDKKPFFRRVLAYIKH